MSLPLSQEEYSVRGKQSQESPYITGMRSSNRRTAVSINQVKVNWGSKKGLLEFVAAAYGRHLEADLAQGLAVKNHAPVKYERGLFHGIVHGTPINIAEFIPLRRNYDRVAVLSR